MVIVHNFTFLEVVFGSLVDEIHVLGVCLYTPLYIEYGWSKPVDFFCMLRGHVHAGADTIWCLLHAFMQSYDCCTRWAKDWCDWKKIS